VNQQMHAGKICFNKYRYSPTCFGRLRDDHQVAIQEYR